MKFHHLRTILVLLLVAIIVVIGFNYTKTQKNEEKNILPKGLKAIIAKNIKKQEDEQNVMTERLEFSSNAPLIQQERFYTEQEINEMSETQFEELLKTTETKLPKLSELKKLPAGALHHTPELIMQAGRDLGLLKEVLAIHESYENSAIDFYEACAQSKERPTPVRALCLTNLIEIKKKNNQNIDQKAYSPELLELTKMITDL